MKSVCAYQKCDADEDVVSPSVFWCHGAVVRWCVLMCVVRLRVGVGLWSPRRPTISTAFKFVPQFPIPARFWAVPLGSVARSLSRENVISVLYRAEPLISCPFRKVRGSTVGRIWVVHPNQLVIFRRTTLEKVSLQKPSATPNRMAYI